MKRSTRQLAWQWVLMGALLMGGGATSAWAQNTFPASGNVGIGTVSPVAKLDINGITGWSGGGGAVAAIITGANTALGAGANARINGNDSQAIDKGGALSLGGYYITQTNSVDFGEIGGRKENGTSGNTAGYLQLGTRPSGGNMTEAMRITSTGNVGIGTASPTTKLHVAGDTQVDGNLAAKYQDVAEWVKTPRPLSPGTVVVVNPQEINQILPASQSYDTRVAGVVSARPGLLLGEAGEGKVKVAQIGRVRVKVDASYGPIAVGDLLVTSATPGHAMRSTPLNLGETLIHRPGTLLGKALEPLEEGQGEILVLLTIQ